MAVDTHAGSYYRARYYDASAGRFLGEDPIGFAGGIDFYFYTKNNPVTFNDPFGWEPNGPGTCGGTTNCDKYKQLKRYDLYLICRSFPNSPKSNCVRFCLQQNFAAGSHGVGSYNDLPVVSVVPFAGDVGSVLGQAFGPATHLMCFERCGLF